MSNPDISPEQVGTYESDGSLILHTADMVVGREYPLMYLENQPAIAIPRQDGSIYIKRQYEVSRNPIAAIAQRLREPLLTIPPVKHGNGDKNK